MELGASTVVSRPEEAHSWALVNSAKNRGSAYTEKRICTRTVGSIATQDVGERSHVLACN